jgi:hypothetical protein
MAVSSSDDQRKVVINVLVIAMWFGLVAGLLEGMGSLLLQRLGKVDGIWNEILWVSPLFDALLFGVAGVVLALAYFIYRRLPVVTLAVFLFATLTLFIWIGLALPWDLHPVALLLLSSGVASLVTRWFHQHRTALIRFWQRSLPVIAAITLIVTIAVQGTFWLLEATS